MNEKLGGARRPQKQIDEFWNVVNNCGFKDLGYSGLDYTMILKPGPFTELYKREVQGF